MTGNFLNYITIDQLKEAVEKLKKEQPFLPDRDWLDKKLDLKLNSLCSEIKAGTFQFQTFQYHYAWFDKYVLSANLCCRDRLVHNLIGAYLDVEFSKDQVKFTSFRPRETDGLIEQCQVWKRDFSWVLSLDIRGFFSAIDYSKPALFNISKEELVLKVLLKQFFVQLDKASISFAQQETTYNHQSMQGFPIGLELCYILANRLLQRLDEYIQAQLPNGVHARYVDDFLIFSNKEEGLGRIQLLLEQKAVSMGLFFNERKTFLQRTNEPFTFLRHQF